MLFPPKKILARTDETPSHKVRGAFRIEFDSNLNYEIKTVSTEGEDYAQAWIDSLTEEEKENYRNRAVEDWPDFAQRGLMLDVSRNRVPTMEWLKQLVDAMKVLRYNELQLYTEHTFAYSRHEEVWKNASPFTPGEIQELDAYCQDRHIELVPNQNTFGHMERWLRHDAYRPLAESPDGFEHPIAGWREFGSTLYPCKESIQFIDTLFKELSPNFSSKQIHVGGDEPWELGKGRSAQRVKDEGKHNVYLNYMSQIFNLAHQTNQIPQFWADILLERPDLVPQLPPNVRPVIWGYDADSPFEQNCQIIADAGYADEFYVAPGAGTWNSFTGRLDVAAANIALAARSGLKHKARGLLLTVWGDNGHHQPWPTLFPPMVLGAVHSWSASATLAHDDLEDTIDSLFFPETNSGNGHALCKLGRVDTLLPQPLPPMSFLHAAFFDDEDAFSKLINSVSIEALKEAKTALQINSLTELDPEIQLGVNINQIALERCLAAKENRLPSYDLKSTVAKISKIFSEMWLLKSRPGGLEESRAKVLNALGNT